MEANHPPPGTVVTTETFVDWILWPKNNLSLPKLGRIAKSEILGALAIENMRLNDQITNGRAEFDTEANRQRHDFAALAEAFVKGELKW